MSPRQPVPDYATMGKAAEAGARLLKAALDGLRETAQREDAYTPEDGIAAGGQSREHYVLAAAEWGMAHGYLRAVADEEAKKR